MGATAQRPFSKRFAFVSSGVASPQGNSHFDSPERAVPDDPVASCTPREMLALGPRTAPGTDTLAAFSHSASVGRRLPAHFAYADASRKLTCETGSLAFSLARCSPAKSRIIHSVSCCSQ